jgi:ubiquinone/menaquinone biosynthesis C-methylase UbiE
MARNPYYFDNISDNFEEWINPFDLATRLYWFASQLDHLEFSGKRVLDVGCGLGYFSRLVAERGGHPFSLDIAAKLLQKIKGEIDNCIQGTALGLPFQDGIFSIVISSECIEHTQNPILAIQEMVRVLCPGGILLFSTPNYLWRWSVKLGESLKLRRFSGIENWLTRRQVRQTLTESGTEIVLDQGLYLAPFQFRQLWPLLEWSNKHAQALRHIMINQCWVARKSL